MSYHRAQSKSDLSDAHLNQQNILHGICWLINLDGIQKFQKIYWLFHTKDNEILT